MIAEGLYLQHMDLGPTEKPLMLPHGRDAVEPPACEWTVSLYSAHSRGSRDRPRTRGSVLSISHRVPFAKEGKEPPVIDCFLSSTLTNK